MEAGPASEGTYLVVVGLGAHAPSPAALRWAVAQAASQAGRAGRVVAIRAWRPTAPQTGSRVTPSPLAEDEQEGVAAAREALDEDVASVLGDAHTVETRLVVGGRRKALVAASADADLLVLDAPRASEMSPAPLQLRGLVYGAHCPVVVMPPELSGERHTFLERASASAMRNVLRAAGEAGRPGVRPPSTARD